MPPWRPGTGDMAVQEIAAKHKEHPNQVSTRKRQAIDGLGEVFSNDVDRARRDHESDIRDLHAKTGFWRHDQQAEYTFNPENPETD